MYNEILRSNAALIHILIILCECEFYDAIFTIYNDKIRIKFKGSTNSYTIYETKYEQYNDIYIDITTYKKIIHDILLDTNLNMFEYKPQSGAFKMMFNNIPYSVRASLHVTQNNLYTLSLRLINISTSNTISNIQLTGHGLILIGGRTCSGKTSLMYNILTELSQKNKNIITIEDPIEKTIRNITQTDIRYISHDECIRSALRQNPDWICIGEIRDKKSAESAIRAAMTGHNVIATIHVNNNTIEAIQNRFAEMECKYLSSVLSQFIYCERINNTFNTYSLFLT